VQGGFLLDVVIGQRAAVLELLAREDKALLIRRNSARWGVSHPQRSLGIKCCKYCLPLLILDLALDIVNCVGALHLESDGLARERLYEDLHGW